MKTLSYVKWYKNISNDISIYHWCHFLEKRQENGWTNHPITAHKWCKCTNTCLPKPIFQQPSNFINSSLQKNAKPPSKRKTGHSPANLGDSRGLPTGWRNASPEQQPIQSYPENGHDEMRKYIHSKTRWTLSYLQIYMMLKRNIHYFNAKNQANLLTILF